MYNKSIIYLIKGKLSLQMGVFLLFHLLMLYLFSFSFFVEKSVSWETKRTKFMSIHSPTSLTERMTYLSKYDSARNKKNIASNLFHFSSCFFFLFVSFLLFFLFFGFYLFIFVCFFDFPIVCLNSNPKLILPKGMKQCFCCGPCSTLLPWRPSFMRWVSKPSPR